MQSSTERYKVLMLGWEFAPIIAGGLGVVCKGLTGALVKRKADITYVLPRIPDDVQLQIDGISFTSANVEEDSLRFLGVDSRLSSPYLSADTFNLATDLADKPNTNPARQTNIAAPQDKGRATRSTSNKKIYGEDLLSEVDSYAQKVIESVTNIEDYDIIHNHDWMTAPAAVRAKELTGKPMVMHVHATEIERTVGHPNPAIFAKELAGMEAADTIIAVSELTKQRIVDNYGIEASKILVVHNAVERLESNFGPIAKSLYKDDQIVLFLARLTAMKGANYLLEAANKVLKHLPKTKFLFVGAGELLEDLIERSVDLNISHKVTFTGFLPHDQVDRAYRAASVFVMPSIAEPFGITPLEAIKNGTPVIISKQSGVSEVLKNVLKVDFWDVDELANKLIAVLKYGVLAEELSNNSKLDLENISWDIQGKKVIEIYSQLKHNQNLRFN